MSDFFKYCKQNRKKIINIMIISILLLYILLNRCFGLFNLIKVQAINNIILIIMIVDIVILTLKALKLKISRDKVKELIKSCIDIFNKYILVKAIVILLIVKILEKLLGLIIN